MKPIFGFVIIFIVSFLLSTNKVTDYQVLENSLSGVLGSLLGGIVAAISIIFALLTTKNQKFQSIAARSGSFQSFLKGLKTDAYVLLVCTFLATLLPYLRKIDIPLLQYPTYELIPSKGAVFTTLEVAIIITAFLVIAEVISILFKIFEISLITDDK